jgi:hypothetical protein
VASSRIANLGRTDRIALLVVQDPKIPLIFHKYRRLCVAFSISKSVESNEKLKFG